MEIKKIGFKTYLLAWITFAIGTTALTFLSLGGIGAVIGVAHYNSSPDDIYNMAKNMGTIAFYPVLAIASFINYCFFTWFFFLRKQS